MANWKNRLNVAPYFHNDDLTLEQKTKDIILIIRSRPWFNEDFGYFQELEDLLEEMSDAGEADDVEWFDAVWNAMYDIFDAERVWVVTR
jgi:hypothetical protein